MNKQMQLRRAKGFTLIEIMIVVAIVIVLSGIAIGGVSNIQRTLRFANSFNQMVLMMQQARSLAVTGKDSNATTYSLKLDMNPLNQMTVFKTTLDPEVVDIETYLLPASLQITSIPACANITLFDFTNGTGSMRITCDGVVQNSMTVGITETAQNPRIKTFFIHRIAGIPQVTD